MDDHNDPRRTVKDVQGDSKAALENLGIGTVQELHQAGIPGLANSAATVKGAHLIPTASESGESGGITAIPVQDTAAEFAAKHLDPLTDRMEKHEMDPGLMDVRYNALGGASSIYDQEPEMQTSSDTAISSAMHAARAGAAFLASGVVFRVPFKGATLTVRIDAGSEKLTRQHLARVREYLQMAETDLEE